MQQTVKKKRARRKAKCLTQFRLLMTECLEVSCSFTKYCKIDHTHGLCLAIVNSPVAETVQHGSERCRLFIPLQINLQKNVLGFNFKYKLICLSLLSKL